MRKVLEFYSDKKRYQEMYRDGMDAAFDRQSGSALGDDEGQLAASALTRLNEVLGER